MKRQPQLKTPNEELPTPTSLPPLIGEDTKFLNRIGSLPQMGGATVKKTVLVTGGAGYIGSHTVAQLLAEQWNVIVVDNLSKGHREALDPRATLIVADLSDAEALQRIFAAYDIHAVIHFAGSIEAGLSMKNPGWFYQNNVSTTLNLLEAMRHAKVNKIVFSSSAAVYASPEKVPLDENHPLQPVSCYGATKLAVESMLEWFRIAYGLQYVALRYFNAAGAALDGSIGEDHSPESHLIPLVLQVVLGKKQSITIFGDDYPTHDGSCIRDYIHVVDLAAAHALALQFMEKYKKSGIFNLGSGSGYSVKQVIDVVRDVTGKQVPVEKGARREGDAAVLVASSAKAQKELAWKPKHSDIRTIVTTAWHWYTNHPGGFTKKNH